MRLWYELMLAKLWRLLPDKCQADYCHRMGVRGNENLYPRMGTLKPLILCDKCGHRYTTEGQITAGGRFYDYRLEAQHEQGKTDQAEGPTTAA